MEPAIGCEFIAMTDLIVCAVLQGFFRSVVLQWPSRLPKTFAHSGLKDSPLERPSIAGRFAFVKVLRYCTKIAILMRLRTSSGREQFISEILDFHFGGG